MCACACVVRVREFAIINEIHTVAPVACADRIRTEDEREGRGGRAFRLFLNDHHVMSSDQRRSQHEQLTCTTDAQQRVKVELDQTMFNTNRRNRQENLSPITKLVRGTISSCFPPRERMSNKHPLLYAELHVWYVLLSEILTLAALQIEQQRVLRNLKKGGG